MAATVLFDVISPMASITLLIILMEGVTLPMARSGNLGHTAINSHHFAATFENDGITPDSIMLGYPLASAHHQEPASRLQVNSGGVIRKCTSVQGHIPSLMSDIDG
jgi:hypothetical protein